MTTFMRLLKLISPFQRWIGFAVALSFLTVASSVALMATSAYLISRAALVTEIAAVSIAITSVRLFAICRAAFRYLERLASHRATFRILAHLRTWFYEAVEPLAPARLGNYRTGDLLARSVADIETLEGFYIRVVVPSVAAGLLTVFACVVLGMFDLLLALVLLTFLVLAGIILPLVTRRLGAKASEEFVRTRSDLNALLVDEIQGAADLLVFDQAESHRARVLSTGRALNRIQERIAVLRGLGTALGATLASLAVLAILLLAIPLVRGGDIGGVYLGLLVLATLASFEAVQPLSPALQQFEASQEAGRRVFELIDAPPPVAEPARRAAAPVDYTIEARSVRFRYEADEPVALDNVSFSLPMGRRLAIFGPSGAGKTTVINLLLRFWDYDAGDICIGGRDLRTYCSEDVRSLIGVVPQNIYLFNATVRDNLLLANPDATQDEVEAACRSALLHEFVKSLPQGYDTLIGENGLLLSGGERQRLGIARAILKDSPIMILDEPTANLDAETERKLVRSLEEVFRGRTVLIISHRNVMLEHADQIIRLESGRVCGVDKAAS